MDKVIHTSVFYRCITVYIINNVIYTYRTRNAHNRIPNNRNDEIMEPLMDYLNCYLKLVENALIDDDAVKADERRKWVDNYLQYRIDNDPARNMLEKSFGRNWTDNALANALFPTESIR